MTKICSLTVLSLLALIQVSVAFAPLLPSSHFGAKPTSALFAEEGNKAGPLVSGEELEMILTELEKPLVIDAYATWWVLNYLWCMHETSCEGRDGPFYFTTGFEPPTNSLSAYSYWILVRCGPCLIMVSRSLKAGGFALYRFELNVPNIMT